MDVGLDDLIKMNYKKAGGNRRLRRGLQNGKKPSRLKVAGSGGTVGTGSGKVVDARLKIIQKTRSKLVDARDRLNQRLRQTDARERIMMRSNTAVGTVIPNTRSNPEIIPRRTVPNQQSTVLSSSDSRRGGGDPLYRTIKNRQPPPPSAPVRPTAYMDLDAPESWTARLANLPRLEIHVPRTEPVREREEWLRHGKQNPIYRSKDDIKSRLDSSRQEGYRIVVSNLQPTVTHEDIKELFEDIGTLIGSRVVRPGTAEVVYKNVDDALTAVDTYHNRQLDGQPMKCLLVKPTNSTSRNLSTKGSIVPDLNTVHKALFTK